MRSKPRQRRFAVSPEKAPSRGFALLPLVFPLPGRALIVLGQQAKKRARAVEHLLERSATRGRNSAISRHAQPSFPATPAVSTTEARITRGLFAALRSLGTTRVTQTRSAVEALLLGVLLATAIGLGISLVFHRHSTSTPAQPPDAGAPGDAGGSG
jgi:hypothetical protein